MEWRHVAGYDAKCQSSAYTTLVANVKVDAIVNALPPPLPLFSIFQQQNFLNI